MADQTSLTVSETGRPQGVQVSLSLNLSILKGPSLQGPGDAARSVPIIFVKEADWGNNKTGKLNMLSEPLTAG